MHQIGVLWLLSSEPKKNSHYEEKKSTCQYQNMKKYEWSNSIKPLNLTLKKTLDAVSYAQQSAAQ